MSEAPKATRPLPSPDDPLVAEFWAHCNRGELCFQRCEECGTWRHLPRFVCASCGSDRWSWDAVERAGTDLLLDHHPSAAGEGIS